jgi:16S rRNA (cytidine1402-2'-O)-methyltransferase
MATDGVLFVVGTPIGNLDDLTPRAVRTLAEADVVLCEDTRRTGRLLQAAGVTARRLMAVHDHNEAAQVQSVVERLRAGEQVALVSDAGMPGVSDPGHRLVRAAVAEGVAVRVVPGPSASVAALVVSGLASDRFVFEGFLPRQGTDRAKRLSALAREDRTVVLYEAPHRLARTVDDLAASCGGDRAVALCRELTKLHEEVWRGTLDDAVAHVAAAEPRGEYVVVLAGSAPPEPPTDDQLRAALRRLLDDGASTRDAVAEVVAAYAVPKRRAYDLATVIARSPG